MGLLADLILCFCSGDLLLLCENRGNKNVDEQSDQENCYGRASHGVNPSLARHPTHRPQAGQREGPTGELQAAEEGGAG